MFVSHTEFREQLKVHTTQSEYTPFHKTPPSPYRNNETCESAVWVYPNPSQILGLDKQTTRDCNNIKFNVECTTRMYNSLSPISDARLLS